MRVCTVTFGGWCSARSGKNQNLDHQCGETVPDGVKHPSRDSPHVCTACGTSRPA